MVAKKKTSSEAKVSDKTPQKRGIKSDYTDSQLKELALHVKNELKGGKLTFLELEKRTGIGRNTWSRRIRDTIEKLNSPTIRTFGITDKDEVYFPNIELLFQTYGNNKNKIIHELQQLEQDYYAFYKQVKQYKNELERLNGYKEELAEKDKMIKSLKIKAEHYEKLYKNIMVSSSFSHLRDALGISSNLINFKENSKHNLQLVNLHNFFPEPTTEVDDANQFDIELKKENNLNKLRNLVPNVIKNSIDS